VSSASRATLPTGYDRRPASLDDVEALSEMWARNDAHLELRPESAMAFLRWLLGLPYVSSERDTVIVEQGGRPVALGIAGHDPTSPGAAFHWNAVVDPAHLGRGLGGWLVAWASGVADGRAAREGPYDLQTVIPAPDRAGGALLEASGFDQVRTAWDMHLDLPVPGLVRSRPDGVQLRPFQTGRDERTFWLVSEAAFEQHFGHAPTPFETWVQEWYASDGWDPARVILAERGGEVVGELAWVDADPDGYIVSVGVLEGHRGLGIAKALLRQAFADISAAGFAHATLSVDAENVTGAVQLYRSVGMETVRESRVFQRKGT
jgi:ribosomal protein S18 acetylase RimI-like enzyme